LGQAPYYAYSVAAHDKPAAEMGIRIHPTGRLHTIENIAGFVGSDTVAAALASGMDILDAPTLLVDIGTNGELVLGTGNKLWAGSCAAGPALEGAGILFGSPAQDGAIQRVLINDEDIDTDVIGGIAARSLCGSGLIDAVAVMLDLGIIEESGRFSEPETIVPPLPKAIAKRLTEYDGQPAFRFSADGVERIRFVGNAAGAGATMILISRHARELAAGLAQQIQYVEIAHQAAFQDAFSACLLFSEDVWSSS
jgi:uncharacterized 2Fe-2S/4Fe-4S cluster protein (DUF4445 family)